MFMIFQEPAWLGYRLKIICINIYGIQDERYHKTEDIMTQSPGRMGKENSVSCHVRWKKMLIKYVPLICNDYR